MKWWIYIAFKQLFPSGKGISFFAIVSVLGVALGVLALYGTQSVMNGFHEKIGEKLKDTSGDITIVMRGGLIDNVSKLQEEIAKESFVEKTEAVIQGPVMLRNERTQAFPMLRSFDTIENVSALPLREKNFIFASVLDKLDDDSIIIGNQLAYDLALNLGGTISVYSPTMIDKLNSEEVPMPVRLKVIGYLNSGFSTMDKNIAVVSLRRMRQLYDIEDDSSQNLLLKINDDLDSKGIANYIENKYGKVGIRAYSWEQANGEFLNVIHMEKTMMSVIIMLVILVASFSICISLYTSVLRKTREIGLISAMGASPLEIISCYVFQGLLIGIFGAIVGLIFTYTLLGFRDEILELVLGKEGLMNFYYLSELPVKYDTLDAITTCAFAVVLCTLAGFIPALLASRLKASEAMRNE